MVKIAVYGTLKRGHYNHRFLENSKFIDKGITLDKYNMTSNGHFPYLNPDGEHQIKIELYEVTPDVLKNLDRLEGHPTFYTRTKTKVLINDQAVDCEIYLTNSKGQIKLKDEF